MATGALPTIANTSDPLASLVNLGQLISLYGGGGGSTVTTTPNISQAGVDATIARILQSEQGLASITSGANRSGLYNSSTAQLLTDDLVARTAAETERARAGQTVTTEPQGLGLGSLAGTLLAAQSIPTISNALNTGINAVSNALGLGSAAGGAAAGSAAGLASVGGLTAGAAGTAAATGALAGGGLAAGTIPAGLALGSAGGAAAGLGAGAAAGSAATGAGGLAGLGGVGTALGPIGLGLGALALTGILGDVSVICTALARKGLVSKELLNECTEYNKRLSRFTKMGYYSWAIPAAARIDKLSVSHPIVRITAAIALPYIHHKAGSGSFIGATIAAIGEPICWMIGAVKHILAASHAKLVRN